MRAIEEFDRDKLKIESYNAQIESCQLYGPSLC